MSSNEEAAGVFTNLGKIWSSKINNNTKFQYKFYFHLNIWILKLEAYPKYNEVSKSIQKPVLQ